MESSINKIFRGDRVIWGVFLFLCLVSIIEVYSASAMLTFNTNYWSPILRHVMFLLGGTFVVLFFHNIKAKYFSLIGIFLIFAWGLLLAVQLWGIRLNDSARWLSIFGLRFQPSEIAKLCLIVFTAFTLSKKKNESDDMLTFWTILIATLITCGLIVLDNGSTALLLFGVVIVMMFIGQISGKRLGLLIAVLVAVGGISVSILMVTPDTTLEKVFPKALTWKNRLFGSSTEINVTDPAFRIDDKNFQESHGYIAIANGGILGRFPGNSTERDILPQAYSDFIYAIIIEEMGLIIGGLGVLLLYIILFIRSGIIAKRSEKNFSKYVVIGCSLMLVSQALTNMAVAVGLIPVTGQPMPLMSRGGTSTLITCVYFGIILSVSRFDDPKGIAQDQAIEQEFNDAEAGLAPALDRKQITDEQYESNN
ncbi:MAG: FtsW/RodA/SpoVE family cell cycle protein [Candidatus Symbiothrix sp.]|jgi:cell division protein FtsW|nr:FtsW/RodA/SpoVE family cell cycle protein [Candidatus Symbiothrix sp.]